MTMINEISKMFDNHIQWLQENIVFLEIKNDWLQITTPYLDRHNDYMQFYVRREGSEYLLTDDGCIISDLIASGCPIDSPQVQERLITTLNGFGVQMDGEQLMTRAMPDELSLKIHNFIQAMLAVNSLSGLA